MVSPKVNVQIEERDLLSCFDLGLHKCLINHLFRYLGQWPNLHEDGNPVQFVARWEPNYLYVDFHSQQ